MFNLQRKFIRWLRASTKHWSSKKDKDYHDVIFADQAYDPFSSSYPGNITIRRFADLAAPYLKNLKTAIDLGCGTGEITCELAKRFPGISFTGIDHSEIGINRAKYNARSLDLNNISFFAADLGTFVHESNVDIVFMFDSFHHLADPRQFIHRIGKFSTRFLLIEPQGNWKGSWKKDVDFDWLILELEKIRARVAYLTGEKEPELHGPLEQRQTHQDTPIEHRYTMDDFKTLFSGYGLSIRGTVSGLDVYPPDALHHSPSREQFGKLAYDLYKDTDERLYERNIDLLAKHWVIFAERGAEGEKRRIPSERPDIPSIAHIKGPYDVEYVHYRGPHTANVKAMMKAEVGIKNRGFRIWSSTDKDRPDYLSYHWLSKKEAVLIQDGERSPFPRPIGPNEECDVSLKIRMPDKPGRYLLAIDIVREKTTWFSDAGSPFLRIPFRIR
ncbi:MAG: class I SAM-dependent methyltransferase [Candidatus Aminicenantes bacterium]|nr:class I SAM-dependent methyltransferase [Candidatus Aminicenantes bacterium]